VGFSPPSQKVKMKKNHVGTIKELKEVNKNVYLIKIFASTLENILPGEYISILCEGLTLRRPFSVADFENNTVTVLMKKRGKGTEYISGLKIGDKVEFSAPLGNTFKIENKKALLVGAGIGVAPLIYLNKKLIEVGSKTYFAAGFLSENDVINVGVETPTYNQHPRPLQEREVFQHEERVLEKRVRGIFDFISTDDGSNGNKGSICDYLEKIIIEFKPEKIVSCAPHPVLKFVSEVAQKHNLECEVCMEKVMACGIGVCRGCVIKVKQGDAVVNKTICKDGPVFAGKEVVW
jgi:dihydroorotate dehydrogenase electron transfer subunit